MLVLVVCLMAVALLTGLGLQLSMTLELFFFTPAPELLLEVLLGLQLVLLNREEFDNKDTERERLSDKRNREICSRRKNIHQLKLSVGRRSFKLSHSYTLKASLRRYSSLAISSATQPGISGMATWMMYFRRIAKCCKPRKPQRDTQHTVTRRHNSILPAHSPPL